jgi:hypothetical protein
MSGRGVACNPHEAADGEKVQSELTGDQQRLLAEALVTYSDSCTLPNLTPSCPFYRVENGFATCDTECIQLIESWGDHARSIGEARIGSLVLTGRKMPLSAAGPADLYDARKAYLEQRSFPVSAQSTGTLLIALGSAFNKVWWHRGSDELLRVNTLWAELERRNVPVERVVRSAVIPQVATQIGMLAATPLLRQDGLWDELTSADELDRIAERALDWAQVLQGCFDHDGGESGVSQRIAGWIDTEGTSRHLDDIFRLQPLREPSLAVAEPPLSPRLGRIVADLRVPYAVSTRFTNRVVQWLNRLLADDLAAVMSWQAPPIAVFLALPPTAFRDEVGIWVWDRFTRTNLDDWATSSLLRESAGNDDDALDHRAWLERSCDADEVAVMALARLTKKLLRPQPAPQLSAESFVAVAIGHLESNRPIEAADIFEGLAELRPTDGDVLNNLGFCLMPTNPQEALAVLQRSSLFPMTQRTINAANRVLALLLVGRAEDALVLARESEQLQRSADEPDTCYAWTIDTDPRELRLQAAVNPAHYVSSLIDFLEGKLG